VENRYLSYDSERAPKVREMFSRLAKRYDLINDLMSFGLHRRWKRVAARLALGTQPPPRRVLDICCGTGDLLFSAGRIADPGTKIVGLDFTLPMLAVARRRKERGGGREGLVQGDALRLPFPDASFGALTIGYGLRNVADLPAALREMRRVLAPGGRAVVLDFGKPDNAVAGALYGAYLRTVLPAIGWLFHGDPETYRYIPASLERYPAQRGVERLMREAGFVNVRYENRILGTMAINVGEKAT
jgi:demethylmenaquinone methyltransferase/2-methoxy-6-polyprenyl-1,4-benzoquinol methylase